MAEKKDEKKGKREKKVEDLKDSVHKVWLAGLGALAAAEEEGSKIFKTLVEKGETYEKRGRDQFNEFKTKVEEAAGKARGQAGSTWEKVEERVDEVVAATLRKTGVPTRDEIATLTRRVEELTRLVEQLKQQEVATVTASTAGKKPAAVTPKAT